ncbi:glyoxalase [Candidatus Roizmanbacteria bacterium RIFCSPLOWO2_01_FULL_40_42]|uniref:Glyoxalase n=1 Tax=Candidatus Roizmanbacteria bacterium RIFCSPLOWO2_01_FULL_40_42 TaxID=1802066 RepID=A0A1F7J216_9BACT|nr:MAG: glyoxalase [Candidatus Roizmanbacteria bacterium RIFCSPHIGHO2_12_41_18]OGK49646.1 MAG: glyoxalase [Candidatus Roizmanbacteria bacterium RIFCSPLOWO2_01_FULL_40_42]
MNPVVHFEMPSKDKKRTAEFYAKVFGWAMNQLGAEMGDYLLAGTTETDENNMVKTPGNINGGFFDYKDEDGFRQPHLVIAVDNLEESMKKVEEGGGKLIGKPMDIPGIGKYISFKDTEDNNVGMLQPSPM